MNIHKLEEIKYFSRKLAGINKLIREFNSGQRVSNLLKLCSRNQVKSFRKTLIQGVLVRKVIRLVRVSHALDVPIRKYALPGKRLNKIQVK